MSLPGKRKSNDIYIAELRSIYGDIYDYSQVKYITSKSKITLICPTHGEFIKRADTLINSKIGCSKCRPTLFNNIKKTNEQYIEELRNIYDDKYDYSMVSYDNCKSRITLICPIHGEFTRRADDMLNGKGCASCSNPSKNKNTESFIRQCQEKHNNKYDYTKTVYINARSKIIITCPIHSDFEQTASNHLQGNGCPICARESIITQTRNNRDIKDTKEFIERASAIHNNEYDYSKVNYINMNTKVTIICKKHGEFSQLARGHLSLRKCIKCTNENKYKTIDQFIEEANQIHNNKYDYTQSEYTGRGNKLNIICSIHGMFSITPRDHLTYRKGCAKCDNRVQFRTTESFIEEARAIHGDRYDYSRAEYNTKAITIICYNHGEFTQDPYTHLNSKIGCPRCANNIRRTTKEFIQEANQIHNNKYDYSKTIYTNKRNQVIIICPDHGEFKQVAFTHSSGSGCYKCGINSITKTNEDFIKEATIVHNGKYQYNEPYVNSTSKIIITCPKHGGFSQTPKEHLKGSGCTKCSNKSFSKKAIAWLEFCEKYYDVYIQHMGNSTQEYKIPGTKFRADGYASDTNTIFEYDGNYSHGNPAIYHPDSINELRNKRFGDLYDETIERENKIKELGYNLVVVWERDWDNAIKAVSKIQNKFRERQLIKDLEEKIKIL